MSRVIHSHTDELFMHRCIELAGQGKGYVAPNPMVGALLVHDNRIIGEGFHEKYGEAHAEVNCINQAIQNGNSDRIAASTIYVSLEPCAHYGKTPPCADLIIRHKIPRVVVGCRDPFKEVDGKGTEKLLSAGVEVDTGVLEAVCKELNKRFFTFHTQHRPYIILKWAQTADEKIASDFQSPVDGENKNDIVQQRLLISNEYTNRLVHKWRSEEAGILVGTNTVSNDDPELTTRLWPGHSPVRLIVDMHLRLPSSLKVFDQKTKTIVFNTVKHEEKDNLLHYQVTEEVSLVYQVMNALYQSQIQSVIVEGGAKLLQSFIDEGMWDEARVISNEDLTIDNGLPAPQLKNAVKTSEEKILSDKIEYYRQA